MDQTKKMLMRSKKRTKKGGKHDIEDRDEESDLIPIHDKPYDEVDDYFELYCSGIIESGKVNPFKNLIYNPSLIISLLQIKKLQSKNNLSVMYDITEKKNRDSWRFIKG